MKGYSNCYIPDSDFASVLTVLFESNGLKWKKVNGGTCFYGFGKEISDMILERGPAGYNFF